MSTNRPHVFNLIAADRGMPEGWQWSNWRRTDDATGSGIVTGAVPQRVYASGPRKGQADWRGAKHEATIVITKADEVARLERWEAETGTCSRCDDGREVTGWSKESGIRTRACSRCRGTGKAPGKPVAL